MIGHGSLVGTLVVLVDRLPTSPPPAKCGRGRPVTYPDRLFLKALVILIVRHLYSPLAVLAQPTTAMAALRALLILPNGRYQSRRT
jgi:hypothetical protein